MMTYTDEQPILTSKRLPVPDGEAARKRFAERCVTYRSLLYRMAMRLTRNPCDAEDLVQTALVRAYERAGTFREDPSGKCADYPTLRAWLCAILKNSFHNEWRRRGRERNYLLPEESEWNDIWFEELKGTEASCLYEDTLRRSFQYSAILAIRKLPEVYRETADLAILHQMSYQEIAQRTGLPLGTVRSRLHRARAILTRSLHAWLPEA